jgi:hypothetical protein
MSLLRCADGVPEWRIAQWLVRTYGLWDADLSLVSQVRIRRYSLAWRSLGPVGVIIFITSRAREFISSEGEVSHGSLLRVCTYMFVLQLIEEDVRNNSAWNERHFVLTRGGQRAELPEPDVMAELRYTSERIHEDVDNSAAWSYLRALCAAGPVLGGLLAVLPLATAVARDHPTNRNALELLADAAMQKVRLLRDQSVHSDNSTRPHPLLLQTAQRQSSASSRHLALSRAARRSRACASPLQLAALGHRSLRCCSAWAGWVGRAGAAGDAAGRARGGGGGGSTDTAAADDHRPRARAVLGVVLESAPGLSSRPPRLEGLGVDYSPFDEPRLSLPFAIAAMLLRSCVCARATSLWRV